MSWRLGFANDADILAANEERAKAAGAGGTKRKAAEAMAAAAEAIAADHTFSFAALQNEALVLNKLRKAQRVAEKMGDKDGGNGAWKEKMDGREEKKTLKQLAEERARAEIEAIRRSAADAVDEMMLNSARLLESDKPPDDPIERRQLAMDKAAKEKARQQNARKRAEELEKKTRGIGNIRAFFASKGAEWLVRDSITGAERKVRPRTIAARPLPTASDAGDSDSDSEAYPRVVGEEERQQRRQQQVVAATSADSARPQRDMRDAFETLPGYREEQWVLAAQLAAEDTACADVLRRLCNLSFDFGCGNDPRCNAAECGHEEQPDACTALEAAEARERRRTVLPSATTLRLQKLRKPYNATTCATADALESVQRRKRDGAERAKPIDNLRGRLTNFDSATLASRMSLERVGEQILRLRDFFWAELSNVLATRAARIAKIDAQFAAARDRALELNARNAVGEASRTRLHEIQAQEYLYEQAVANLNNSVRINVTSVVNSCTVNGHVVFALPPQLIVSALVAIVHLADGANRDDAFYMSLCDDVCIRGRCDNLWLEVEREKKLYATAPTDNIEPVVAHRGAFAVPPPPPPQQQNGARRVHFSADLVDDVAKRRKATVEAVFKELAAEQPPQTPPQMHPSPPSSPVPSAGAGAVEDGFVHSGDGGGSPTDEIVETYEREKKRRRESAPADDCVVVVEPEPVRREAVCAAQATVDGGQVACAAIALLAASRLIAAHKADEMTNGAMSPAAYAFGAVSFDKAVQQGASLWRKWKAGQADDSRELQATFMMTRDVLQQQPKIEALLAKKGRARHEWFGEWRKGSASEYAVDKDLAAAAPPFSVALAKCEELGAHGVYAGVLTVGGKSVCVARVDRDAYFIFDSHGAEDDPEHGHLSQYASRADLHDAVRALLGSCSAKAVAGVPHAGIHADSINSQYFFDVIYEKKEAPVDARQS
jgi:hypothetical protein